MSIAGIGQGAQPAGVAKTTTGPAANGSVAGSAVSGVSAIRGARSSGAGKSAAGAELGIDNSTLPGAQPLNASGRGQIVNLIV